MSPVGDIERITQDRIIALFADKSKLDYSTSELITNGDFSNGTTGWSIYQQAGTGTLTASGGVATLTNSGTATSGTAYQAIATKVGYYYQVTGTLVSATGSTLNALRKSDDSPPVANVVNIYSVSGSLPANTVCNGYFVATATTTYIAIQTNGAGQSISFKNISVKAVAMPELVTNGNFSNGTTGWSIYQNGSGGTLTASGGVATLTNGGNAVYGTAYTTIPTVVGVVYRVSGTIVSCTGTTFNAFRKSDDSPPGANIANIYSVNGPVSSSTSCLGCFSATSTVTYICLQTNGANNSISFSNISVKPVIGNHATQPTSACRTTLSALYNQLTATNTLSTQSVTTVAATYTLTFSGGGTITLSGTKTGVYSSGTSTLTGVTAGTLTLTVAGTVTNADLRVSNDGVGLPTYQSVTNANTYDSVGFPYYIKADGVDDSVATAAINFSGTNKITVVSGLRKLSDSALAAYAEFSPTIASNAGAFLLSAPNSAAANYNFSSKGTTQVDNTVTTYTAPITSIVTGIGDISAPNNQIRINGSLAGTQTGSQGTGNYGNFTLYVFRRTSASSPFNGRSYGLIIRGASSTSTEISNTETWLNDKTKAY